MACMGTINHGRLFARTTFGVAAIRDRLPENKGGGELPFMFGKTQTRSCIENVLHTNSRLTLYQVMLQLHNLRVSIATGD